MALLLVGPLAAGCGTGLGAGLITQPLLVAECRDPVDGASDTKDVVVLNWDRGTSPIYPDYEFEGLDLTQLELLDGGTVADDGARFKERVRDEIARVLDDLPGLDVEIQNDTTTATGEITTVLISQALQPGDGLDIGEGEYDPCNRQHDNAAIIYSERIAELFGANTFEEWVNVFANVCAHEIGHTLGFGHVERGDQPEAGRPLYVELMLSGHTIGEMRRPQRIGPELAHCTMDGPEQNDTVEAASIP